MTPLPWKNLSEMDRHFAASNRRSAARRGRVGLRLVATRLAFVAVAGVALAGGLVLAVGELSARVAAATADPPVRAAAAAPPAAATVACPVPADLRPAFRSAADRSGVPLALLVAVAQAESGFDRHARSSAGAYGTMQVLPSTGAEVALDVADPQANVLAGARYLDRMLARFDGSTELALAAYHAGPTAVARSGGAPFRETVTYVADVQAGAAAVAGACGPRA